MKKWHYYNEVDPKAAAWIRELIKRKLIPEGEVDERSITEVKPDDVRGFIQAHWFAGICGWPLALQLAGVPATARLWTGSCPCQPFSAAGKGLAQADERHLWPVFFDLIRQCRPQHVFGEQVASAIGHGWLDGISADLEAEGYACGAAVLGAHSVKSPHQRQRLYWVANDRSGGREVAHLHNGSSRAPGSEWASDFSGVRGPSDTGAQTHRLDDARRPSDERRGESGDVGCQTDQEQGEARQREQSGDANSDSVQDDCGMVLADSDGCSAGSPAATPAGHGNTIEPAGSWIDGLADTNGSGSLDGINGAEGWRAEAVAQHSSNIWNDFTLAHCRDGKTRRIPTEPSFFPLAHGVPARVVRLRGYGNAIVPQVAAEFIAAYYDCASIR